MASDEAVLTGLTFQEGTRCIEDLRTRPEEAEREEGEKADGKGDC